MKDLTVAEVAELASEIERFVQDMALVGLACIVIVEGRGHSKCGYPAPITEQAPAMLAHAYNSVTKHNDRKMN